MKKQKFISNMKLIYTSKITFYGFFLILITSIVSRHDLLLFDIRIFFGFLDGVSVDKITIFSISTVLVGLIFSSMSILVSACERKAFKKDLLNALILYMKLGMSSFGLSSMISLINSSWASSGVLRIVDTFLIVIFSTSLIIFFEVIMSTVRIIDRIQDSNSSEKDDFVDFS